MKTSNWLAAGRSFFSASPPYLIFQVTSHCNARCRTCFNWEIVEAEKHDDLTLDEIEKCAKQYGRLLQLTIGGGEPFLRDDLSEICRLFNAATSVQHITIPTNALLPQKIDTTVRTILKDCNVNYVRVGLSLDGIGDEHDRLRNVPGNYEKLLETYRLLCDIKKHHSNFGIEISTVLSGFNKDTLKDTIKRVSQLFPDIDKHAVVLARGSMPEPRPEDIDAETYRETIRELVQANATRTPPLLARGFETLYTMCTEAVTHHMEKGALPLECLAGRRLIVIMSDGSVFPCETLQQKLGNLRQSGYNIHAILNSSRAREMKAFIKNRGCSCTFECAIHASLIFNMRHYPKLAYKMLKH